MKIFNKIYGKKVNTITQHLTPITQHLTPITAGLLLLATLASCQNGDNEFPDYENGVSVYFAYQTPVRTITLGSSTQVDLTNDNNHCFEIYGAQGGSYNTQNITVTTAVDNSLLDNVYFDDGTPVKAMPTDYYTIASDQMHYESNYMGSVKVQLNDKFFQDPASLTTTYVIPMVMKSVTGADSILVGKTLIDGETPSRLNSSRWDVQPKDYTLYCVRYVNPWQGYYILKTDGVDLLKSTILQVNTLTLTTCSYTNNGFDLTLDFGDEKSDVCSIYYNGQKVGEGNYGHGTEAKAFANLDRDALYLNYTIDGKSYSDTLVLQRRGEFENTVVTFNANYK